VGLGMMEAAFVFNAISKNINKLSTMAEAGLPYISVCNMTQTTGREQQHLNAMFGRYKYC